MADKSESRRNKGDPLRSESEIVSEGKRFNTTETGESSKKWVVGDDKNQRRKRTTLLDTTENVNKKRDILPKTGGNFDIVQGTFDK